jgi:2-dehydropantoate 2-reductase
MNIAIYGAGAMGTVLGAYITKAGHQIDLINRNKEHINALQSHGAKIIGTTEFTQKVTAFTPDEMIKQYDIIFLMTKQRYNKEIVGFLQKHLKESGILCTLQNGIPEPDIAEIIGPNRTVGGTMSWGASFHGHGVAELTTIPSQETLTFQVGEYGHVNQILLNHIVTLLNTMGNVELKKNLIGARWAKLIINSAFSGLSVVTGATFGELAKNRFSRKIALELIKECIEVGHAAQIKIEPIQGKNIDKLMNYKNFLKKTFSYYLLPYAMRKHKAIKSSMLRDLQNNRKTEIDSINGVVVSYGKQCKYPTPLNNVVLSVVHNIEEKKLQPSWDNLSYFTSKKSKK